MGNFDDFDLDVRKINDPDGAVNPNATLGPICTLISGGVISSIVTGCTDKCTEYCSKHCTTGGTCEFLTFNCN